MTRPRPKGPAVALSPGDPAAVTHPSSFPLHLLTHPLTSFSMCVPSTHTYVHAHQSGLLKRKAAGVTKRHRNGQDGASALASSQDGLGGLGHCPSALHRPATHRPALLPWHPSSREIRGGKTVLGRAATARPCLKQILKNQKE